MKSLNTMVACVAMTSLCAPMVSADLWDWEIRKKTPEPAAAPRGNVSYNAYLGLVMDSSVGNDDFDTVEFGGHWELGENRKTAMGDFDFDLNIHGLFFSGSAGIGLPDQLATVVLDIENLFTFRSGLVLETHVKPGLYFDLDDFSSDAVMVPFSLQLVTGLGSSISGTAGLDLRPGFEREIMPILGVRWAINDKTALDLMIPRSLLRIDTNHNWSFWAGYAWENMDYALGDDQSGRGQITIEDFRLTLGGSCKMRGGMQLSVEYGKLANRSVEYEDASSEVDVSDEAFIRVGVGGPF